MKLFDKLKKCGYIKQKGVRHLKCKILRNNNVPVYGVSPSQFPKEFADLERELTETLHKELQTDLLKFMEQTDESKRVFAPIIKNVKRNIKQ